MRFNFVYICFVTIHLFAGEHRPACQKTPLRQHERAIERLRLQIKDAEKDREDAINCRNDSRDPLDQTFYAQQITSAYFLIQELRAQLLCLQPKS